MENNKPKYKSLIDLLCPFCKNKIHIEVPIETVYKELNITCSNCKKQFNVLSGKEIKNETRNK